ncbi:MAG TPA: hypothetical protein VFE53_22565 [Mucilaginibacter sp.]|jgi:type IV secretory pathway VirB10-like protein|nr:hypothetical protein [Mucilaginibacter sp.]
MIKWIAYIGFLLIFAPISLSAKIKKHQNYVYTPAAGAEISSAHRITDTTKTKKQEPDDKKKIKEVAKAKKQPKPEKVEPVNNAASKTKNKRQRRPEGMERPPEIPRRNGN